MSTVDDNGEGIIGQYVFIGGKPHAVLETDHSLSVFPQVDVTTCVLPLSEHKRGRRPPPAPSLSPLSKSEPPAPRALRTGPALTGPPQRERAPLVWTNVGVLAWNEPKVRGISAWARPLIFLITHRKLLLQRTLSQSICTEDWGSYGELWGLPAFSFLAGCVGRRCID